MDLNDLRQTIDSVDQQLVSLLNERARTSLLIGRAKRLAQGDINPNPNTIFVPNREIDIYEKVDNLIDTGHVINTNIAVGTAQPWAA